MLDLYLGQQDNGALPTSTEARQAYDGMTAGFGVGANGPLLVSVDMSKKPAKADQEQLDKIDKQESDQKKQAQAERRSSRPQRASRPRACRRAAQAQAQVQPQLDAQTSRSSSRPTTSASSRPAGDRPAAADLRDDLKNTNGVTRSRSRSSTTRHRGGA